MGRKAKFLLKVLLGKSDANISFLQLCELLKDLGFTERIRGSHHIFTKDDIEEILNIQPLQNKAKAYQVKQIRNLILKHNLGDYNADSL